MEKSQFFITLLVGVGLGIVLMIIIQEKSKLSIENSTFKVIAISPSEYDDETYEVTIDLSCYHNGYAKKVVFETKENCKIGDTFNIVKEHEITE